MTAATTTDRANVDVGRVIGGTLGYLQRDPFLLVLSFVLYAVPYEVAQWIVGHYVQSRGTTGLSAIYLNALLTALLSGVFLAYWQGVGLHRVVSRLSGKPVTLADSLTAAARALPRLLGLAVVQGVGVGLATLLFIVPGVMLSVRWSMAAPTLVLEKQSVGASLSHSGQLTQKAAWPIFGLFVVFLVCAVILGALFGLTVGLVATSLKVKALRWFATVPVEVMTAAFSTTGVAVVYHQLNGQRERIGADQLAAVFD